MTVSQELISQQVGVSRSAVSHVLNGRGHMVSAETRQRIQQALDANGYHRNALVRALKAHRTHVIGVIVPEVGHSFFSEVVGSLENEASAHGLQCFLCQTHSRVEVLQKELTALQEYRVDGVLIFPSSSSAGLSVYQKMVKQKFPFVIVDVPIEGLKTAYVGNDNTLIGRIAAEHFLACGHRRIAFVNGFHESHAARERLAGYHQAIKKARLEIDPALVVGGGFRFDDGRTAVEQLLKTKTKFTAIIASSDFAALGVIHALEQHGLKVPSDVSVLGCGNIDFSSMVNPPLSTIDQKPLEIGKEAINALVKQIEGKGRSVSQIFITPELIVRNSTAPLE